jgi:hypothetical protein
MRFERMNGKNEVRKGAQNHIRGAGLAGKPEVVRVSGLSFLFIL